MRTTVTLDADTHDAIERLMRERKVSFKQAVNDAIRAGTSKPTPAKAFKTYDMGPPLMNLDKAMQLAGRLDDEHQMEIMGMRYLEET